MRSNPALFEAHYELAQLLVACAATPTRACPTLWPPCGSPRMPPRLISVSAPLYWPKANRGTLCLILRPHLNPVPILLAARLGCAKALLGLGELAEAEGHLRSALRAEPDNIEGHRLMAEVYLAQKRTRELRDECTPRWCVWPPTGPNPLTTWLGFSLPIQRLNSATAQRLFSLAERACQLTGGTNLAMLATLAAAYAEANRFPDSARTQQKVCDVAAAEGESSPAETFKTRLGSSESFRAALTICPEPVLEQNDHSNPLKTTCSGGRASSRAQTYSGITGNQGSRGRSPALVRRMREPPFPVTAAYTWPPPRRGNGRAVCRRCL